MIIKSNTLADFSARSKCNTHPSSAKDNMLYKRIWDDLIRLKAENITSHQTLKLSRAYMVIRSGTWGIWTDCAIVRAELLDGVLNSGLESSFQKWFRVPSDHLNMKPLDSIGPMESMGPLDTRP